jgi:hypothetical protein
LEREKSTSFLVGMPQGQMDLPLERPRCRWKCTIKVELEGIGWKSVNWVGVCQNKDKWRAVASTLMNLLFGFTQCGEFLDQSVELVCSQGRIFA